MAKTKRGRPALPGDRYPSGERRDTNDPRAENVFQRFADLEKTVGLDPRLTSQIGRLRYLKLLSDGQAAAADKVGQIYGRFERIHARRRHSVSPSYQLGRGHGEREYDTDVVKAVEADYRALQDCIPLLPREARDIIEQLCVENCAVPSLYLPEVRVILDRVAAEFGLGAQGDEDRISAASTRRRAPRAQSRRSGSRRAATRTVRPTRCRCRAGTTRTDRLPRRSTSRRCDASRREMSDAMSRRHDRS